MQRVHRKRHQIYEEKDFEIQSLTSLIRDAKKRTYEAIQNEHNPNVTLPLHGLTERLSDNMQHMHHHLQNLLVQKLGPDARHVIAAERARLSPEDKARLARKAKLDEILHLPHHDHHR